MSIGENVKALRLRKGLTQSQLAKAAEMPLTQISRIENNDTDPKASTLNKVINALGCNANDLFNEPSESQQMSLEDFIDNMDVRAGMDMKTVAVLWRTLENHQGFIKKLHDAYKDEPNPHAAILKQMSIDVEKHEA